MSVLWLTRPLADSEAMQHALKARGIASIVAPVMEIVPCDYQLPANAPTSILLTSRYGAAALPDHWRDCPLYAVGEATANSARAKGYKNITTGDGSALDLLPAIVIAGHDVLHLCGEDIKIDLAPLLAVKGITLSRLVTYQATAVAALAPIIAHALRNGDVSGLVLYSPRAATIAHDLLKQADCLKYMAHIDGYCLSLEIAGAAGILGCKRLHACPLPTQQAMMELLSAPAISAP
jgi:uroporphyrinogen-III synthase